MAKIQFFNLRNYFKNVKKLFAKTEGKKEVSF